MNAKIAADLTNAIMELTDDLRTPGQSWEYMFDGCEWDEHQITTYDEGWNYVWEGIMENQGGWDTMYESLADYVDDSWFGRKCQLLLDYIADVVYNDNHEND